MRKIVYIFTGMAVLFFCASSYSGEFIDLTKKADTASDDETKIENYTKAVAAWKSSDTTEALAETYSARGDAYYSMGLKHTDKAVEIVDRIGAHDSESQDELYKSKQDYAKAAEDYDEAVKLGSNKSCLYRNRGSVYYYLGDKKKAVKYFDKSMELNPNDHAAYHGRGRAYLSLGKKELADADFTKAKELDPENWRKSGKELADRKDYQGAINALTKAIELKPDYYEAYRDRGSVYMSDASIDKAVQDLTKAIELNPSKPDAYISRGTAYDRKDTYDKAIEDFTKAIELQPDYFFVRYKRGVTHYSMGLYEKAIDDYTKALELGGKEAGYVYKFRKWAYDKYSPQFLETCHKSRQQKYNEITEDMRKLYIQAGALAEEKRYGDATLKYRQALEQGIWFADARYNLANIYAAMKDYEGAILQMKCYMEFAPDEAGERSGKDAIYGWETKSALQTSD